MAGFLTKTGLEDLMLRIPIHVIMDPQCGLWGAADYAWRLACGD